MGKSVKDPTGQVTSQEHQDALAVEFHGGPAALDQRRAQAMALSKAEIVRFKGNAPLASFNAIRGVESLRSESAQCEKLPGYDRNVFDKTICLSKAFAWAAHEAQTYAKPADASELLKRARASRRLIYPALISAVRAGLIGAESIKSIAKATGGLKLARACIDCALVMKANAHVLAGKTPIAQADIDEAQHVGALLLGVLRPKAGHILLPKAHLDKIEVRDRVWTLLSRSYDYIRRAGAFVHGDSVDELVPALLASRRARTRPLVLDENGELVKSKAQLAREKRAAERQAKADARAKAEEKLKAEAKAKADAKAQAELEATAKKKETSQSPILTQSATQSATNSVTAPPAPTAQAMATMVKNLLEPAPPSSRSSGVGSTPTPMNGGIGSA